MDFMVQGPNINLLVIMNSLWNINRARGERFVLSELVLRFLGNSYKGVEKSVGLRGVEVPRISRNRHLSVDCQPYAPAALATGTHFC